MFAILTRQELSTVQVKLLTRLSPISHLVTSEVFFVFETFSVDLDATLRDSPNKELDFRLCHCKQVLFD